MLLQQWGRRAPPYLFDSYCHIKKGALMILATIIMTRMRGDPNNPTKK
jgi:hypothetical protein